MFLKNILYYNSDINAYETRNANKLYIPLYRNNFSRTQISYKGPVLWNSLSDKFKLCPLFKTLKGNTNIIFYNMMQ